MQDAPQADPKKLFIGNLSFDTTKETVENMFSDYGQLTDVVVVIDRVTGRSRGIGFVTYETEEQAKAAIEALDGVEVDGREIAVNVARPRRPRQGGFNRGGRNGGGNDRRGGYRRDN